MSFFIRTSSNYIAPPGYAVTTIAQTWGHLPFDCNLLAIAANWYDDSGGLRPNTFQCWVNGAGVGPILSLGSGGNDAMAFDTPVLVPGVTSGNIDGAGRVGILSQRLSDCERVCIRYEPANAADFGKSIIGTGSDRLATADTVGYFAPLSYWQGDLGQQAGSGLTPSSSDVFRTPFEQTDGGHIPGDNPGPTGDQTGIAITPLVIGMRIAPMLVCHDGVPGGVYTFNLRANGATVVTITTAATSQRIWLPTGAQYYDAHAGDEVCWELGAAPGTLAGELLCSVTPSSQGSALGFGESFGQF